MVEIWKKFKFDTSDEIVLNFLWANHEGTHGLQHAELNKTDSLTRMILDNFEGKYDVLENQLLLNVDEDFADTSVLGSHLDLLRELKSYRASGAILRMINTGEVDSSDIWSAIDIFLQLGGDPESLLPYFEKIGNFNVYFFWHLVKILHEAFPERVKPSLLKCLSDPTSTDENKLIAAQYLGSLGVKDGYLYITNFLKENRCPPYYTQSNFQIWNVETEWGLEVIRPLMHLAISEKHNKGTRFYSSPKNFLLELINGFAVKSENELLMVERFLQDCASEMSPKHVDAPQLLWYAEQILEKFRQSSNGSINIRKIKEIISLV